ncbi:MAG: hypothetical protein N2483_11475, partial [Burkholderiaceae bacterium]|nr:hypothetical protein [Burkholderiaceae bacterium]
SKTDETIQRVFSFIGGILILSASLASLFLGWSKIVRIAEFVGKDVGVIIGPIPMSGSLFLLLIIFIAFFLAIAWGFSLVYFGITGRRVR